MVNYLILAVSTAAASGKALFCKALGLGGQSARKTILLNSKSFLVSFVCSLLLIVNRIDGLLSISAFSVLFYVIQSTVRATEQIVIISSLLHGKSHTN